MLNELKHWGVLGMKWGRRKSSSKPHSDHSSVETVKSKGIRFSTDKEVEAAIARMRLVKKYRESGFKSKTPISQMSNSDLKKAEARGKLMKEDRLFGVRKSKRIKDMTDDEVAATLKRHGLEKTYRELRTAELVPVRKFVTGVLQFVTNVNTFRKNSR